jgi:putative nucleotidyltransferase with HDIG domain
LNGDGPGPSGHLARAALAPLVAAATAVAFPPQPLGAFWVGTMVVALFGVLLLFMRPELYRSGHDTVLIALGFAGTGVVAGIIARQPAPPIELIPVALPVFLFAVLFDARFAAVAAMALAVFIGTQPALAGTEALAFCFVGGVASALSVRRIRSRGRAYGFVATVGAIYAAAAAVSGLVSRESFGAILTSAGLGAANALGSAALAMLLLPAAETFTRATTDLRLLELSDPNRPLLRRLAAEAPGTWAHSLALANLCEAACNAVGANGLLARVGCYYHDIGKLGHPGFFLENQQRGTRNPHDALEPAASAALIRRHVTDGIALAQEHRLPEQVIAFIPEHHGTQEISYFAERSRDQDPAAALPDDVFRYPGPLPRSAETAITMLGDGVEAALRVLDDPTPETIDRAIAHLVRQRFEAGQLAEAPLTLREIETVRRTFVRYVTGMHHNRIAYPEDAGGITADWSPDGA